MEATCSYETSVHFKGTTWRYIQVDRILKKYPLSAKVIGYYCDVSLPSRPTCMEISDLDLDEKVNLLGGLEGIRTKPIVAYLKSDIRLEWLRRNKNIYVT
jgi:hypothetical protein